MSAAPLPFEFDLAAIRALPPDEQEEQLANIDRLKAEIENNPQYRYLPHEGERAWKLKQGVPLDGDEYRGQQEYHELNQHRVEHGAHVAGNRGGKTHGGVADNVIQTLPRDMVPWWLLPYKRLDPEKRDVRIRIVGPDLGNWLAKVMLPKCRLLIPPAALWKGDFDKAYSDRTRFLRFADGSWWDFLSHDMTVAAFSGTDLDRIHWDEEPPGQHGYDCWEESIGRITDREGDMRYTLTPLFGLSWLYYELTGPDGDPRRDNQTWVVRGDIDHNPHMTERGKQIALKVWAKDPLKYQARKSGRWLHFEGLVYPEYHPKRHVVPDRPIPTLPTGEPAVPVYEVLDPGIDENHPFAYVAAWMNPDGQLEVFHTHRIWQGTAKDMAAHVHEVRSALGFKPRWTKIDPSGANKHPATGKSTQDALKNEGIRTEKGNNQREAGINEVKQRLKAGNEDGESTGEPLIVFQESCTDLVDPIEGEFVKHRWKKPSGRTEDRPKAGEVIKRDDDCLDCVRYLCMGHPLGPKIDRDKHEDEHYTTELAREHMKWLSKRRGRKGGRVGGVFRR